MQAITAQLIKNAKLCTLLYFCMLRSTHLQAHQNIILLVSHYLAKYVYYL